MSLDAADTSVRATSARSILENGDGDFRRLLQHFVDQGAEELVVGEAGSGEGVVLVAAADHEGGSAVDALVEGAVDVLLHHAGDVRLGGDFAKRLLLVRGED